MTNTARTNSLVLTATSIGTHSLIAAQLEKCACCLLAADDAGQCLAMLQAHQPQLVIIEDAPLERDGARLCRQIRASAAGTLVPLLALVPDDAERISALLDAGATDICTLPLHPRVAQARIQHLLREHQLALEVQQSEQRWWQAFHDNHSIKLIIDPETGQIVDANQAAAIFYGYSLEQLCSLSIHDLDASLDGRSRSDTSSRFNFRHRLASGEVRDVKVYSGPIDYYGERMIYSVIFDISKRRQAEASDQVQRLMAEALGKTASVLSSTLDLNEVFDRILDQVGEVVQTETANIMLIDGGIAHIVRARGYEKRNPVIYDIRLPVATTANLRWIMENRAPLVIPDTEQYPGWVYVRQTEWIRSHISAPITFSGHTFGFLNLDSSQVGHFDEHDAERLKVFADQAAIAIRNARLYEQVRRQAVELERRVRERTAELDYERRQLGAILDAMTEGVIHTQYIDGRIVVRYINPALTRMTGYTEKEWREQPLRLLSHNPDAPDEEIEGSLLKVIDALNREGIWRHEFRMRRKDGSELDVEVVTTQVIGADGQSMGAVTVVRDVSQERALQAQKTRFVAYASHELRTPLTNLKTRLYLMRKQPERLADHMAVLDEVTDRMRRLVEDLLDISRFERGIIHLQQQVLELQELVAQAAALQRPEAERKGLSLSLHMIDEPILVMVDPERIFQVITNLLTNAINYTPAGGSIKIRVQRFSIKEQERPYALVQIEDNGIGIASEHLPHIFQAFYRVASEVDGSGLGLNIAKEIIELHGGRIGVESAPGVGSTFSFWLPAVDADPQAARGKGISRSADELSSRAAR
ncbi:MAG: ATP-binding protein [Aggregatilineales bacterium]